jgi:hypothetical protein
MISPTEAPMAGRYSKESKVEGQNFLMKAISKHYLLISCRQIISQPLPEIHL